MKESRQPVTTSGGTATEALSPGAQLIAAFMNPVGKTAL